MESTKMSDDNEVQEVATDEVAETEAPKGPKGPRMAKKVAGVSKEAALIVLAESNPKRANSASYDRFQGYLDKKPATVQEALDAGLTIGDIHYDIIHGSIEVEGAEVTEYEVKPRGPRAEVSSGDPEAVAEPEGDDEDGGMF